MSTRCQIGFYQTSPKATTLGQAFEALIYRHCDGYPGTSDGKKKGGIGGHRAVRSLVSDPTGT